MKGRRFHNRMHYLRMFSQRRPDAVWIRVVFDTRRGHTSWGRGPWQCFVAKWKKKSSNEWKKKQRQYRPLRIYHIFLLRWPFLWWPLQSWDAAISRESFEVRTVEKVRLHVSLFSHRWIRFAWNECFSALIHPFEYLTEDRRPLHWLYSSYMCNRLQNPAQTSSQNTFRSYSHLPWCFLHK